MKMVKTVKKIDIKKLGIAIILAIGSLILFLTSQILIGVIVLILSILLVFLGITYEVILPDNKPIKRVSYYFDKENISILEKIIKEGVDEKSELFPFSKYGNGRLDVIFTKDNEFLSLKLFRFIPHRYEEASGFIQFTGEKAKQLRQFIKESAK